jgi:hypothetical protein
MIAPNDFMDTSQTKTVNAKLGHKAVVRSGIRKGVALLSPAGGPCAGILLRPQRFS